MARQPKAEPKRDHQLTVRIPSALRTEIESIAERERRSIADIVVFALEDYAKRATKGGK